MTMITRRLCVLLVALGPGYSFGLDDSGSSSVYDSGSSSADDSGSSSSADVGGSSSSADYSRSHEHAAPYYTGADYASNDCTGETVTWTVDPIANSVPAGGSN